MTTIRVLPDEEAWGIFMHERRSDGRPLTKEEWEELDDWLPEYDEEEDLITRVKAKWCGHCQLDHAIAAAKGATASSSN